MSNFLNLTLIVLASVVLLRNGVIAAPPLTRDEVVWVQERLEASERGKYDLAELENPDVRKRIIAYYLAATNPIPLKAKLMVSSCFAWEERYTEAVKLAEEYVQAYPNEWEGLSMLGRTLLDGGAYGRAVKILTNAAAHINTKDVKVASGRRVFVDSLLADAALLTGRSDILRKIVPELTAVSGDQILPERLQLKTTLALASYAISTRDSNLFVKAVGMVSVEQIQSDPSLKTCVRQGCYVFPSEELAAIRLAFRDAAKKEVPHPGLREQIPITVDEFKSVRQLLKDHDEGENDLYAKADFALCQQLAAYYLTGTNAIPTGAKLAISLCMDMGGYRAEAIKLAEEFLQVYSNDWRAWRIIGLASYREGAYGKSFMAFTNTVALGGSDVPECYSMLTMTALLIGRPGIVGDIVPTMLKLREADSTKAETKLELTFDLVYYAVATNDRKLFVKALENITVDQILSSNPLRVALFIGHNFFQAKETEPLWQAFQKAAAG